MFSNTIPLQSYPHRAFGKISKAQEIPDFTSWLTQNVGSRNWLSNMLIERESRRQDKDGRTPLWGAAQQQHKEVVMLLLEMGKAEVETRDNDGRTPLWWAARQGHREVEEVLMERRRANIDARDQDGRAPHLG